VRWSRVATSVLVPPSMTLTVILWCRDIRVSDPLCVLSPPPRQVFVHVLECVLYGLDHVHTRRDVHGHCAAAVHYDVKPSTIQVVPAHRGEVEWDFKLGEFCCSVRLAVLATDEPGLLRVSVRRARLSVHALA
jgi:hypothetical protein